MKKIKFFALMAIATLFFVACGPQEVKAPFSGTNFVQVNMEGSQKYGVKTLAGEVIVPMEYSKPKFYDKSFFLVSDSSGKLLVFDTKGKIVIPASSVIKYIEPENHFAVSNGNTKGIFFIKEGVYIEGYQEIAIDALGNLSVKKADKYGVISRKGTAIIPVEYDKIATVGKEYITLKPKGKPALYDKKGNIVWNAAELKIFDSGGKFIKNAPLKEAQKAFK